MGKLQTLKQKVSDKWSDVRTGAKIRRYERSVQKAENSRLKREQQAKYRDVYHKEKIKALSIKARRKAKEDVATSRLRRAGEGFLAIGEFLGDGQHPVKKKKKTVSKKKKGAYVTIDPKGNVTIYQKQKKKKKKKEKKRNMDDFFEGL